MLAPSPGGIFIIQVCAAHPQVYSVERDEVGTAIQNFFPRPCNAKGCLVNSRRHAWGAGIIEAADYDQRVIGSRHSFEVVLHLAIA